MNVAGDELLNVRETARRLGVHENTIRNWVKTGALPDARVPGSRHIKVRARDVERLVNRRGAVTASLQTERRISNPELVAASQLLQWADTRSRDAQERFPELLRRLLVETAGISAVSIRAGDGVAMPGFDGLADSDGTASFLPAGHLVFEFGTDRRPQVKAQADYDKRWTGDRPNSTFVFVTPRRWPAKDSWATERRRDGRFADVRVVDADDLEGWLLTAPAAHHWISEHLGLRPRDAVTLEMWWSRFSASTEPALPAALFVSGRSSQADQLVKRLAGGPVLSVLEAETARDCLAFVHAVISRDDAAAGQRPPVLKISSPQTWDRIVEQPGRAILIPDFDDPDVGSALRRGHHVISVVDRAMAVRRVADISLPRLGRHEARDAFVELGVEFHEADRLAALGRRNLPALVRKISLNPTFRKPIWSGSDDAAVLGPLMLTGSWTTSAGDLSALEAITGVAWSVIEPVLQRLATNADPVIRIVGQTFAFTSSEEAFLLLRGHLTMTNLERWSDQARAILLEPDPVLSLSAEDRALAGVRGIRRHHSATLRRGVATGLALLGSESEVAVGGVRFADHASAMVQDLLSQANADRSGRMWHQLADVLPLLSEAAPETLLRALDEDLRRADPVLRTMFHEESSSVLASGPSSPHPNLLWALETMSWSADHLHEAVSVLARLAALVGTTSSGNRPMNSLSTILCGWVRHTGATTEDRIAALDATFRISSDVGWRLVFSLWPDRRSLMLPPAAPRVRDWRPAQSSVLMPDWVSFVHALVDRAIRSIDNRPDRLAELVENMSKVPPSDLTLIMSHLEENLRSSRVLEEMRLPLWECLRTVVAKHDRHPQAAWSLPADIRDRLRRLGDELEPKSDPVRLAYLFAWRPEISGVDRSNFDHHQQRLAELRDEALTETLGLPNPHEKLTALTLRAPSAGHVGWALASRPEVDTTHMLSWLASDEPPLLDAAANWLRRRMQLDGVLWLTDLLHTFVIEGDARKVLLRNIPASSDFWDALQSSDCPSDEVDYWRTVPIEVVEPADTARAVQELVAHGRAWTAIAVAAHGVDEQRLQRRMGEAAADFGPDSVVGLLEQVMVQPAGTNEVGQMTSYYLGVLLDYLTSAGTYSTAVAQFEFAFFTLLEHDREPAVLNSALAAQPELFVELACRAFRGRNESRSATVDNGHDIAAQAWWVLHGWQGFPGRRDDGTVDGELMTRWVRDARLALSEADRTDIGDELIGQSFARSPLGADGVWPAEPIRELLESTGSKELETGLIIGRLNSRGVTSRPVFTGGGPERDLAAQYNGWSAQLRPHWPRAARVLRDIGRSYEHDARREDMDAELGADRD